MIYSNDLMVKVCKLYYEEDFNFNDISRKLKLSRFKIYRIMKKAKESGIVKINIAKPLKSYVDLEIKFEKLYNLKRVFILENLSSSVDELKNKLSQAGAELLLEILDDQDIIGISWGSTVQKILNQLPIQIDKKVEVVQLSSGSNLVSMNMICHDLTRQLAERFGTTPHLIFAPQLVGNKELRDLLIKDESIKKTFDFFDKITVVIFGIGAFSPDFIKMLLENGQITAGELDILIKKKAVGDIFSNYIDFDGKLCDESLTRRLITMPVEKLRNIPYSLALAGGKEKAKPILAAIRGGYINMLVTDKGTIEEILDIDDKQLP